MNREIVTNYLENGSPFLLKINQINKWNQALKECLADNLSLAEHCQLANLKGNSLIVIVDNPHWQNRLRFYIPELLSKLKAYRGLENIKSICSKVEPRYSPFSSSVSQKRPAQALISQKTAALLLETANKLKDAKLGEVLKRIAGRCK